MFCGWQSRTGSKQHRHQAGPVARRTLPTSPGRRSRDPGGHCGLSKGEEIRQLSLCGWRRDGLNLAVGICPGGQRHPGIWNHLAQFPVRRPPRYENLTAQNNVPGYMVDHGSLENRPERHGGRSWSADLKSMPSPCFRSNAPCTSFFTDPAPLLRPNDAFAGLLHDGFRQNNGAFFQKADRCILKRGHQQFARVADLDRALATLIVPPSLNQHDACSCKRSTRDRTLDGQPTTAGLAAGKATVSRDQRTPRTRINRPRYRELG